VGGEHWTTLAPQTSAVSGLEAENIDGIMIRMLAIRRPFAFIIAEADEYGC
jgi:hypothetical protein